jgi:hypothetical protein
MFVQKLAPQDWYCEILLTMNLMSQTIFYNQYSLATFKSATDLISKASKKTPNGVNAIT